MVSTTNLVSYYKLDENAANTTVADAHGSNTGTASVNTSTLYNASGKINSAFDLEASSVQYVNMGDVMDFNFLSDEFSMSAWIKLESTSANNVFITKQMSSDPWDGYSMSYDSSGRLEFSADATGSITVRKTITLNTAQWYHIVFTYDGTGNASGVNIYVDGTAQTGLTIVDDTLSTSTVTSQDFKIGARGSGNINPFDGLIDEVAIFNTELTSTDVTDLYNSGNGLAYPFVTTVQETKTGNSRIEIEQSQTKTGTARIEILDEENVYDGKARVELIQSQTKTGNSRIEVPDNQVTKDGKASIILQSEVTKTGNSRIEIIDNQVTKTGNASIKTTLTFQQTKDGTARIETISQVDKEGNSRIEIEQSQTKTGTARIEIQDNQVTKTGNADIFFRSQIEKTGNAFINILDQFKPIIRSAENLPPKIRSVEFFNLKSVKQSDKDGNASIEFP